MRIIEFSLMVEFDYSEEFNLETSQQHIQEMEDFLQKNGYNIYNVDILEDGEVLTDMDELQDEDDCGDLKEQSDFAQDDGYDGILGEG